MNWLRIVLLAGLLIWPTITQAAEDFILWQSATFTSPYAGNVIAVSSEIANASNFTGIKVFISYENITPDVCGCAITAVIEEEISTDIWVPLGAQNQAYGVEGNGPRRVIIVSPSIVLNPGVDFTIEGPDGDTKVSELTGSAPDNFRVRLTMPSPGNLTSITISGYGRKF